MEQKLSKSRVAVYPSLPGGAKMPGTRRPELEGLRSVGLEDCWSLGLRSLALGTDPRFRTENQKKKTKKTPGPDGVGLNRYLE